MLAPVLARTVLGKSPGVGVLGLLGVSLLLLLGIDAKVNAGYVWNWVRSK